MSPASLFRTTATALYGEHYLPALAVALGENTSTLKRYGNGSEAVPEHVWTKLKELVAHRSSTLKAVQHQLHVMEKEHG